VVDDTRPGQASAYLEHLPAVFREGAEPGRPPFLGRFLLAFEHLLTGLGDPAEPGLDELLDRVPDYFDPERAPAPFLDWLAGWVAVALRGDLEVGVVGGGADAGRPRARALVAAAVPLYRLRGTKRGMEALIRLFTGGLAPTITEVSVPLQLGRTSTIGLDTQIGGGAPHYFHVLLRLSQPDPVERRRVEALVRSVIDVEKPAHTRYRLDVITPSLQVGHSHVGVDTLLSPS
jgi:phage tail-like protein